MTHRRILTSFVLALMLILVGSLAVGFSMRGATAQDTSTQDHPLVGTWLVDTDLENDDSGLEVFAFDGDGTYVNAEVGGSVLLGAWEATGATTAILTIVGFEGDEEGNNYGSVTIRASIEVSADGEDFTAEYTFEFTSPDGTSTGEAGPGMVIGTRMVVEGPGTPVMTLDEFFGGFEGDPEASPAP